MSSLKKIPLVLFAFSFILLITNKSIAQFSKNPNDGLLKLIRIENLQFDDNQRENILTHFDVVKADVTGIELIVNQTELNELKVFGLEPKLIRHGKPLKNSPDISGKKSLPSGYSSLDEIIEKMQTVAADHPDIAELIDVTNTYNMPTTFEGRHMYILKISDNVNTEEDEPDLLIVSNHHAREVVTPVIAQYAIDQFTDNYGSDATITNLVNEYEIWIAPTWNPDGYNYMYNIDDMWRKNRRVGQNGIGVDQNRNYPHLWNSSHSGSLIESSNIYKGPSAGSEPETQTMIALSEDQKFEKVMDFHSSGRQVLWGYYEPDHPFDDYMGTTAFMLAINSGYTGAGNTKRPSADGEHYQWQLGKTGSSAFLIETHTQFGPSYASALAEAERVWPGIVWNLQQKTPLSDHVTDSLTGKPIEAEISFDNIYFHNDETNFSDKQFGYYRQFCPSGTFQIRFSADGYAPVVKEVTFISDFAQTLDVKLKPSLAGINEPKNDDAQIEFHPSYPNPCNTGTNLSYTLKEAGYVTIEIYNASGSLVLKQTHEFQTPGSYQFYWNLHDERGQQVSDGMYVSRLVFNGNNYSVQKLGKILVQKLK